MRPRTRIQKQVAELFPKLPNISVKQRRWGEQVIRPHRCYVTKREMWCSDCGAILSLKTITASAEPDILCPVCGSRVRLEKSLRIKDSASKYVTYFTTFHGWQVVRHFLGDYSVRRGMNVVVSLNEAVQVWINESGQKVVVARKVKPFSYRYYDNWSFSSPMEIREWFLGPYGSDRKYDIFAEYICPHGAILPILRRNGYSRRALVVQPDRLFRLLLTDPSTEQLVKTKQFALLEFFKGRLGYENGMPFAHAVNICTRNGYIVKDASMWYDYMELLEHFHLDTHNAKYVCPANLQKSHDELMERKRIADRRARQAAERELERRKAIRFEEDSQKYIEAKSKFFSLRFATDDNKISLTVIPSVEAMQEEGQAMHHCVFENGYYKKPDSLIMSAKNAAGKRLATIELSLKTFKVVQCRAACNAVSPHQEKILNLIQSNINQIKKIQNGAN